APLFDEHSARTAAPVVPLEEVARRRRFATWAAGGWRDTVRSPQFRRSWPLALLLAATLVAAVAAAGIYKRDDAAQTAPATGEATAGTATDTAADAEKTAAQPAPKEIDDSRVPRDARRASNVSPDTAAVGNREALAASALGNPLGNVGDERPDVAASGRDERNGERDKGKRQKRSKRRQGASRGGAVLFDVIR
ncbi:MAG TPA: hypothetical protein VK421_07215, partial [Pyrinomonadaceae bacterium]|nr:hypothetical protein [Pyrinomonadaceae bacterium]